MNDTDGGADSIFASDRPTEHPALPVSPRDSDQGVFMFRSSHREAAGAGPDLPAFRRGPAPQLANVIGTESPSIKKLLHALGPTAHPAAPEGEGRVRFSERPAPTVHPAITSLSLAKFPGDDHRVPPTGLVYRHRRSGVLCALRSVQRTDPPLPSADAVGLADGFEVARSHHRFADGLNDICRALDVEIDDSIYHRWR